VFQKAPVLKVANWHYFSASRESTRKKKPKDSKTSTLGIAQHNRHNNKAMQIVFKDFKKEKIPIEVDLSETVSHATALIPP
jgi:hypothetical protein